MQQVANNLTVRVAVIVVFAVSCKVPATPKSEIKEAGSTCPTDAASGPVAATAPGMPTSDLTGLIQATVATNPNPNPNPSPPTLEVVESQSLVQTTDQVLTPNPGSSQPVITSQPLPQEDSGGEWDEWTDNSAVPEAGDPGYFLSSGSSSVEDFGQAAGSGKFYDLSNPEHRKKFSQIYYVEVTRPLDTWYGGIAKAVNSDNQHQGGVLVVRDKDGDLLGAPLTGLTSEADVKTAIGHINGTASNQGTYKQIEIPPTKLQAVLEDARKFNDDMRNRSANGETSYSAFAPEYSDPKSCTTYNCRTLQQAVQGSVSRHCP